MGAGGLDSTESLIATICGTPCACVRANLGSPRVLIQAHRVLTALINVVHESHRYFDVLCHK